MKALKLTFAALITTVLLFACKKDNSSSSEIHTGTYSGTFKVTYSSGTHTGNTTLELKSSKYSCTGNSDRIPAGGSGTYSFDQDKITFKDENYWTADFDGNLVLNGEYDYTFDGKNLKISANKNNVGFYEYILVKN